MTFSGRTRVLGGGAVVVAALAISGRGAATYAAPHRAAATGRVGGAAVARAAAVSGAAQGERVAYTLTGALPHLGAVTLTGTGTFNNSPDNGSLTAHVSVPASASSSSLGQLASSVLSKLDLDAVYSGSTVYLQVPSSLSGLATAVTHGKSWLSVDLATLASHANVPGLSSLLGTHTATMDPTQAIDELKAASANGVTQVGNTTVNGVNVTEYRGALDLTKLTSRLPAALRAKLAQRLAQAHQHGDSTQIPFTVDIDAANLIRRITFTHAGPASSGTTTPAALTLNFLSYGPQAAPALPAAGDTENLDGTLTAWARHNRASVSPQRLFGG